LWDIIYGILIGSLYPINLLLFYTRREIVYKESVLHISGMVHIPWRTVRVLQRNGMKAEYLAIGSSPIWDKCDYQFIRSRWPHIRAVQEFVFFWKIVARYEVIHSHFMVFLSETGWEDYWLKRMGRKIVVNYRGCDIRDRKLNMELNPRICICEECDYGETCEKAYLRRMRSRARRAGDLFLVTTPDLKDFVPDAAYFPFFCPDVESGQSCRTRHDQNYFKIVHTTNHPGIEGTKHIRQAISNLVEQGYKIDFAVLTQVPRGRIMKEYGAADLAIGKMKMGYYANAQIESMAMGVPTITYVRPDFMTEELRESGFIFTTLDGLEGTIRYYLDHPEALSKKKEIARSSILSIHDNSKLANELIRLYRSI
jgi:hypothetical protein